MWSELRSRNEAKPVAVQSSAATPINPATQTGTESSRSAKPTPEQIASTQSATKNPQKSRGVVPASNIESEPDDGLIRNIPTNSPAVAKTDSSTITNKPAEADTSASAPPQVSMVTTNEDSLHGILAPATSLPQLEPRLSQGVSPLVLEHKVIPAYPHQALVIRRDGPVVVRAIVTDSGKVSQVKLLSGDPMLGRAAMDAIRQWRYHPALLNGKPTQTETDITLNFKLP
jgi:TonB family protein